MRKHPEQVFLLGLLSLLVLLMFLDNQEGFLMNQLILVTLPFAGIAAGYRLTRRFRKIAYKQRTVNGHFILSFTLAFLLIVVLPQLEHTTLIRFSYQEKTVVEAMIDWVIEQRNIFMTIVAVSFILVQVAWLGSLFGKNPNLLLRE